MPTGTLSAATVLLMNKNPLSNNIYIYQSFSVKVLIMVITIIIMNIVVVLWNGLLTLPAGETLTFSHASFYKRKTLFNWNISEKALLTTAMQNTKIKEAVLLSRLEMWVSDEKVKGHK